MTSYDCQELAVTHSDRNLISLGYELASFRPIRCATPSVIRWRSPILLGSTIVTSMRYNVTARCDTPNHFSIPSRCLTQSIDFYRPSSLPSRLFNSSGSTTKCNIACLHSLPRVEKPGRGHPEKNLFRTGIWRKETLTSGGWH